MIMKFLLVRADNTCSILEIEQSELFDIIRPIIDCDWIETVHIGSIILMVDELGKLHPIPKPINPGCSMIYPGTPYGDPIVGDVVIGEFGTVDGESDIVGLSDRKIEVIIDIMDLKLET